MRVSDYNKATVNADDDYFVIDGNTNGTRSLPASSKVNRSKVIETTFLSSNWVGDEAPFANEILIPNLEFANNIEMALPESVDELNPESKGIVDAYQSAMILNGKQGKGSIIAYAWGSKPTIDLPVALIIRDDAPLD